MKLCPGRMRCKALRSRSLAACMNRPEQIWGRYIVMTSSIYGRIKEQGPNNSHAAPSRHGQPSSCGAPRKHFISWIPWISGFFSGNLEPRSLRLSIILSARISRSL